MKLAITLVAVAAFLSGCAPMSEMASTRKAVNAGLIGGMDKDTRFMWSRGIGIPDASPGPYRSIEQFNVIAQSGLYSGRNVTFFLGKSRETGDWEVFCVMVEEGSGWRVIPLRIAGNE